MFSHMTFGRTLFPSVAVFVFVHTWVDAAPLLFRVIDLGTLGGAKSEATAISDAGHVVGWSETTSTTAGAEPVRHAFLWFDGQLHDLGSLGGPDTESIAYGVNSLGQVVGWTQAPLVRHAFLWLPEPAYGLPAGMNDLGTMGHEVSEARDINVRGEIVGTTDRATFLWLPQAAFGLQEGMNDLCLGFPGAGECPHSSASLNDRGQIGGHVHLWLPYAYYGREAGWSFHGASISDISNSGFVVGNSSSIYGVYYFIHNLWQEYGHILQFPFCGSFDFPCEIATGLGVNDLGHSVGRWRDLSGSVSVGVFSEPEGGARWWFLDQSRFVYSPGWYATTAADINNYNYVAATGIGPDGVEQAVLLEPIDPDIDRSGAVTFEDYGHFWWCLYFGGPGNPAGSGCARSDLEGDNDIDLLDYVALLRGLEERE